MPLPRPVKWIGIGLGALIILVLIAGTTFGLIGRSRLHALPALPPGLTDVPADSATLAHGEHLVAILGCRGCHAENLGGQLLVDMPLGRFIAPNITAGEGGVARHYTAAGWDHAIRFGVRPDSSVIIPFMPYPSFNHLSDDDTRALIAYLQQVPPVDNVLEATTLRVPGYLMLGLGARETMFGNLVPPPATSPAPGSVEQGGYLASMTCTECHGKDLAGGKHPDPAGPPGPSLRPYGVWAVDTLAKALRTGIAPGNRPISEWMPWQGQLEHLDDAEIAGIREYIRSLGK